MDSPTEKQMQVIRFIEENLGIKFDGITKMDAREFISSNMEKSRAVVVKNKVRFVHSFGNPIFTFGGDNLSSNTNSHGLYYDYDYHTGEWDD